MHHHPPDTLSPTHLRISLAIHAGIFVVVNVLLIVIDLSNGGNVWFFWPLLGWGIGLAYHVWAVSRRLGLQRAGHDETPRRAGEEGSDSSVPDGDHAT